ncbi:DUF6270 domain-containing protein [Cellulomonas hominis]
MTERSRPTQESVGLQPLRTVILGSCVSRDTFEFLDPERYTLACYVARQSWATVARPPGDVVDLTSLRSEFQRRVLSGALHGDMLRQLESAMPADLVLLDLTDERLGLHETPKGGLVTRSVELVSSGLEDAYATGAPHLRFGSRAHRRAWHDGADLVLGRLRDLALLDRTFLLAPPWASRSAAGHRDLRSVRTNAATFTRRSAPYVRAISRVLGGDHVLGKHIRATADAEHRWGLAPFHYTTEVYREIAVQIDKAAQSRTERTSNAT